MSPLNNASLETKDDFQQRVGELEAENEKLQTLVNTYKGLLDNEAGCTAALKAEVERLRATCTEQAHVLSGRDVMIRDLNIDIGRLRARIAELEKARERHFTIPQHLIDKLTEKEDG